MMNSETANFMTPYFSSLALFELTSHPSLSLQNVYEDGIPSSCTTYGSTLLSPLDFHSFYDIYPTHSRQQECNIPLICETDGDIDDCHHDLFLKPHEETLHPMRTSLVSSEQDIASLMKEAVNMNAKLPSNYDQPSKIEESTTKDTISNKIKRPITSQAKNKTKGLRSVKTRPNVKKACASCQKSHVACDTERPCRRCVLQGRGNMCFDSEQRQKGRPRGEVSPQKIIFEHSLQSYAAHGIRRSYKF